MRPPEPFAVLFCCMANFCRSPTAEGVFRHMVRQAGLQERIHIDSAGTHDWRVGSPPDRRSTHHAGLRGYDLSDLRSRQVERADFERFDLVCAMDHDNMERLARICPPRHRHKLRRLMEFAPPGLGEEVQDPYSGGDDGFETVLDHIEAACAGLLNHVRTALGNAPAPGMS